MDHSPLLLVDDEPIALDLGARLLRRLGFEHIDTAACGAGALALLGANSYRVVISDWNMPEMSGLELLYRMRKTERLRKIPFLMTSVDGGFDRVRLARKVGVNAFLLKPFDAQSLRAKIIEVLGCPPELRRKPPSFPLPAVPTTEPHATCPTSIEVGCGASG